MKYIIFILIGILFDSFFCYFCKILAKNYNYRTFYLFSNGFIAFLFDYIIVPFLHKVYQKLTSGSYKSLVCSPIDNKIYYCNTNDATTLTTFFNWKITKENAPRALWKKLEAVPPEDIRRARQFKSIYGKGK